MRTYRLIDSLGVVGRFCTRSVRYLPQLVDLVQQAALAAWKRTLSTSSAGERAIACAQAHLDHFVHPPVQPRM